MSKINSDLEFVVIQSILMNYQWLKNYVQNFVIIFVKKKNFDFTFNDEIETSAFIKLFFLSLLIMIFQAS